VDLGRTMKEPAWCCSSSYWGVGAPDGQAKEEEEGGGGRGGEDEGEGEERGGGGGGGRGGRGEGVSLHTLLNCTETVTQQRPQPHPPPPHLVYCLPLGIVRLHPLCVLAAGDDEVAILDPDERAEVCVMVCVSV